MWICVFVFINILTTSITPGVCCALNLPVFCSSLGCVTVLWPLLPVRCVFVQTVWMYRGWGRDYPPAEERAEREGAEADWYQTGGVKLRPPPWPDTRSHEPHAGMHTHTRTLAYTCWLTPELYNIISVHCELDCWCLVFSFWLKICI